MTPPQGRVIVVTGASAGIGAAAAAALARLGATVAVVGRSPDRTAEAAARIGGHAHLADFQSLDDVRRLAAELLERYPRIDVLANNAGALFATEARTPDGHERTFQVNHLAPFLLTNLLLDRIRESPDGRVIFTCSSQHAHGTIDPADLDGRHRPYRMYPVYRMTKLAQLLHMQELARRLAGTSATATAFNPGLIATDGYRDAPGLGTFMGSRLGRRLVPGAEWGARPLVHLASAPGAQDRTGLYFHRAGFRRPKRPNPRQATLAAQLWNHSLSLTDAEDPR
ncbi:NAD(P)-dependent dehydrogenase (short-subunit alcohol dehydrogenase family) [Catenuloplanes nepalensis]|uniref:NAD(P)-dependent dehydrogenase (Short-subunit alcohol dehydrogenase family) n=1 Tax=Catenuloplanes nepalensis TaxID=587533 RepID=A0ABT9MYS2_9ACTN|nr:SDR family NAD(P)-dependent oxidoreductase [Catenuloplanes nepalensis]MDP9796597.1 NAD(P)-dependent dehydrogenase (short-subunit alcohol dehydrogenase family) [Catenuloplanes nepalensis]